MSNLLGVVHGLDFILSYGLLGGAIFIAFILPAGGAEGARVFGDWSNRIGLLVLSNLITTSAWLLLSAHDMADSWAYSDMRPAIFSTHFGHFWCLKIICLVVLALATQIKSNHRSKIYLIVGLAFILPAVSVMTGHAAAQDTLVPLRIALDAGHAVAVGIWTGGLWSLFLWLSLRIKVENAPPRTSFDIVTRFSHFAMISAVVIALTGVTMTIMAKVPLLHPWTSLYGLLISWKVLFFAFALMAAAINQFLHLRHFREENELKFSKALRREAGIELSLIGIVFLLAGFLTRTSV
jgi:putative copper export protein